MASTADSTSIGQSVTDGAVARYRYLTTSLFVIRLLIGMILLWAGLLKLQYPSSFLDAVYQYKILGLTSGMALAVFLPAVEVLAGMCLLLNIWTGGGLLISTALGLTFVGAQALVMIRGDSVDCGCLGSSIGSASTVGWWTLMRAMLLVGLAVLGYLAWAFSTTRARNGAA